MKATYCIDIETGEVINDNECVKGKIYHGPFDTRKDAENDIELKYRKEDIKPKYPKGN